MDNIKHSLAEKLLQIKAIRLNPQDPFTWASGIQSPIYCDNRLVLSFPEVRNLVKQGLKSASASFETFDVVAGVATAGIAHGALLADVLDLPNIYVRSKRKGHGRQNLIEGKLVPGSKVLVIEDLISTGGSSLKAVEAVREAGGEVVGVLALFSYGFQEAEEAFRKADCPLLTLSDYPTLLEVAVKEGYLQHGEVTTLKAWRQNPRQWQPTLT